MERLRATTIGNTRRRVSLIGAKNLLALCMTSLPRVAQYFWHLGGSTRHDSNRRTILSGTVCCAKPTPLWHRIASHGSLNLISKNCMSKETYRTLNTSIRSVYRDSSTKMTWQRFLLPNDWRFDHLQEGFVAMNTSIFWVRPRWQQHQESWALFMIRRREVRETGRAVGAGLGTL